MLKSFLSAPSFHGRECTAQLMLFCSTDVGFTFVPWAGGEAPLWRGCLCPHPWATISQGQGQCANTMALPGWPRVPGGGGRHSGCHSGIAVPCASIPTQLEAFSWAYSCTVGVLSWLFQEQDSEEMSRASAVTLTAQGPVAKAGRQSLARVFPGTFVFPCCRGSN